MERSIPLPWWRIGLAVLVWVGLWSLTPGLLAHGVGSWFSTDPATATLIEMLVAVAIVAVLMLVFRRQTAALFAPSWQVWCHALSAALAVALPFHDELPCPWGSTWAGWPSRCCGSSTSRSGYCRITCAAGYRPATIVTASVIFALGHVVWLPHRFGVGQPLAARAMVALGIVIASLRTRFGALHVPLALHLAFYYGFA